MSRNVVVLCLDTVRKDAYDAHADRLSDAADVSFAQCRAASSWSPPSHASMLTGRLPHQHGVHAFARGFDRLTAAETFLGDLPDHRTLGASANVYASSAFGFDDLFDEFVEVSPNRRFEGGMDIEEFGQRCDQHGVRRYLAFLRTAAAHDRPIRTLLNGAYAFADEVASNLPVPKPFDDGATAVRRRALRQVGRSSEPFVQFVNVMDAHAPHTPVRGYDTDLFDAPNSWTSYDFDSLDLNVGNETDAHNADVERFRDLYAAAVDYTDRVFGAYVERVRETTDLPTTVVVTADHGENLGYPADDGMIAHAASASEGLLHVPLDLINPPEGYPARVDEFVSHLSLQSLVAGLGAGETPSIVGTTPVLAERVGSLATADERLSADQLAYLRRSIRCAYEDGAKFEWDSLGTARRHRLDPDRPNWQDPVAGDPDVSAYEALFDVPIREYHRRAEREDTDGDVDDATLRRLQDLGYA